MPHVKTGDRFTRWTVIEADSPKTLAVKRTHRCQCDCGTIRMVKHESLCKKGKRGSRSCGCGQSDAVRKANTLPDNEGIINKLLKTLKTNADRRGRAITLSRSSFVALITQPCHYCGCAPDQDWATRCHNRTGTTSEGFKYHGLDRIDGDLGYYPFNVVTCCKTCNFMKGKLSYDTFTTKIKAIAANLATTASPAS